MAANGMIDPRQLRVGQKLKMPAKLYPQQMRCSKNIRLCEASVPTTSSSALTKSLPSGSIPQKPWQCRKVPATNSTPQRLPPDQRSQQFSS
jgi:hypothetical protein